MTASYEHLPLADLKPGMVLSDEILDAQGQVLLPKGAILNPATLALLPSHGIEMVAVLSRAAQTPRPERAVIEKRLDKLFRKTDIDEQDDGATTLLRRYITNYRLATEDEE